MVSERNRNVEISAMKEGTWIRIEAKLVRDESIEAKESMLEANPSLRSMYDSKDDNMEVWYLEDAKATISSFTSNPKVIEF